MSYKSFFSHKSNGKTHALFVLIRVFQNTKLQKTQKYVFRQNKHKVNKIIEIFVISQIAILQVKRV